MAVTGQKVIADNIKRYGGGFIRHVNKTMGKVSKLMDSQVEKNMTLSDHTIKDLRRLGHPCSGRHGPEGRRIHKPYWQVHEQSGQLLKSKKSGTEDASISTGKLRASAYVLLDENKAPHAAYVVFGTSKMIPRPVLRGSLAQIQGRAINFIKGELKDLTINFRTS